MLKDKLEAMKSSAASQTPPEKLAIMLQTRDALTDSGILERVVKVGSKLADFTLADANGHQVSLAALRQQGPVLISLYRGVW